MGSPSTEILASHGELFLKLPHLRPIKSEQVGAGMLSELPRQLWSVPRMSTSGGVPRGVICRSIASQGNKGTCSLIHFLFLLQSPCDYTEGSKGSELTGLWLPEGSGLCGPRLWSPLLILAAGRGGPLGDQGHNLPKALLSIYCTVSLRWAEDHHLTYSPILALLNVAFYNKWILVSPWKLRVTVYFQPFIDMSLKIY